MTTTKTIKVYASIYCSRISTNIKDFVDVAIRAGDLQYFDSWLELDKNAADLYDLIAEGAGQSKTCKEILASLRKDYEDYVKEQMKYLFDCCTDDYWSDEIVIEVEVAVDSELNLQTKIEAV